jgi:UDP-glucose 4-epimerase
VSDLASAHVRALQELEAGATTFIRNLATGSGHSVLEVMQAVEAATGRPVPHGFEARREGDPPALTATPDAQTKADLRFPELSAIVQTAVASRNSGVAAGCA